MGDRTGQRLCRGVAQPALEIAAVQAVRIAIGAPHARGLIGLFGALSVAGARRSGSCCLQC